MTLRAAIRLLVGLVLGLPLLQAIFTWVTRLLTAMGDQAAAGVLGHITLAASVLWIVSLVGLVLALAVQSLDQPPPS